MQNLVVGKTLYYCCCVNAPKDKAIHLLFISLSKRVQPAYIPWENILNLKNIIQDFLAWDVCFYCFIEAIVSLESNTVSPCIVKTAQLPRNVSPFVLQIQQCHSGVKLGLRAKDGKVHVFSFPIPSCATYQKQHKKLEVNKE